METNSKSMRSLYIMQSLAKGFSVFYFVLLPIFYSQKLITSKQIGYIGALFIVLLILGAIVVARKLHSLDTRKLLLIASFISILASALLLYGSIDKNLVIITISYGVMGLSVGTAMSGVNVVAANLTKRGDRYRTLARLSILTDLVRIVFPTLVAVFVAVKATNVSIVLIIFAALLFLKLSSNLPKDIYSSNNRSLSEGKILNNGPFRYALSLEFFDSFSSSQLFVFLPLLFLAKGYSIQSSLILQSLIFLGYLCGRFIVSYIARYSTGIKAVAYAELGMFVCIILILITKQLWVLYLLSFILGVFARGTSPVIKALSFDSLETAQMKQGSALHVVAGDSGSALAQLLFGLLIAWYGIRSPFIVAAVVAVGIAILCIVKPLKSSS